MLQRSHLPLLVALLGAAVTSQVAAQSYPERPIQLVLPTSAGGGTDALTRVVAARVAKETGWALVVENRAGADGQIAAEHVAKSAPDGHTFLVTPSGHLLLPFIRKNLPYDTLKDLVPVTALTAAPSFVVVSGGSPIKDLPQLMDMLRANPGKYNFATPEPWGYLQTSRFNKAAGVTAVRVPYRGAGQMLPDVASGNVTYAMTSMGAARPFIEGGRLRALCVAGAKRTAEYSNVPTCVEAGVNFVGGFRYEVYAPARTPVPMLERVQKAFASALRSPEVTTALRTQGLEAVGNTQAEFAAEIVPIFNRIGEAAREAGLVPE